MTRPACAHEEPHASEPWRCRWCGADFPRFVCGPRAADTLVPLHTDDTLFTADGAPLNKTCTGAYGRIDEHGEPA
ncbi:hypothetical protein [Kitasatospora sp. NPDC088783]|uniref:hypothetical protein n=1 Tax=Kitasatospora sp. NPDC088783 TaxID=3364077 RepID=UPI003809D64A